jgi:methyl-accepting chemotaxis protein
MGVDVKTSGSAEDNLPAPSSSAVQQVNQQAESTNPTPPAVATVASVPAVPHVSETLDNGTTNAVLAASATSAAVGPASEAVATGAGIINNTGGSLISGINSALTTASDINAAATDIINTANQAAGSVQEASIALGSFAQTPEQLVQSGILKPGSSTLATGLASAGKTLTNTMPAALFTGLPGAASIEQLAENTTAQAASLVSIMQTSQQQLTDAGVINGTESNTQTAGLISASTALGAEEVISVVRQISSTIPNISNVDTAATGLLASTTSIQQQTTSLLNNVQQTTASLTSVAVGARSVLNAIGAGQAAAKLSDGIGGLGGIANSLTALSRAGNSLTSLLNSVKGVSGSAFSAIKNSFGKLEPNKPQFLSDFAKQTASATAVVENSTSAQLPAATPSLSSLVAGVRQTATTIGGLANNINNTVNSITRSANALTATVNNIKSLPNTISVGTITNATNQLTNTINSAASTFNNLNNTVNSVSNTVNGVTNAVNSLSTSINGITSSSRQVSSLINSTTGLSSADSLSNSISTAFNNINSMAGAATSLTNGLSGLANAAKTVQSGGLAAKASQLSSGVSNLPGGIKAFSSVLDKAETAINRIPGTDQLTSAMNSLQTEKVSGIDQVASALGTVQSTVNSVGSALGAVSSATNAVGTALGLPGLSSLARTAGGLTASISSKLPIGQATQLLSAVSALGAGGASPIKLPNLGFNTSNRTGITAQIDSVIGDPGIPKPNLLGDISDQTISSLEQELTAALTEIRSIESELSAALQEESLAYSSLLAVERDLPFGDSSITEARTIYLELTRKTGEIQERYVSIIEEGDNPINSSTTTGFI